MSKSRALRLNSMVLCSNTNQSPRAFCIFSLRLFPQYLLTKEFALFHYRSISCAFSSPLFCQGRQNKHFLYCILLSFIFMYEISKETANLSSWGLVNRQVRDYHKTWNITQKMGGLASYCGCSGFKRPANRSSLHHTKCCRKTQHTHGRGSSLAMEVVFEIVLRAWILWPASCKIWLGGHFWTWWRSEEELMGAELAQLFAHSLRELVSLESTICHCFIGCLFCKCKLAFGQM